MASDSNKTVIIYVQFMKLFFLLMSLILNWLINQMILVIFNVTIIYLTDTVLLFS
jgi:hypothetical protein